MAEIDDARARRLVERIEHLRTMNPEAARRVEQIIDDMVTYQLDFLAACALQRPPGDKPS